MNSVLPDREKAEGSSGESRPVLPVELVGAEGVSAVVDTEIPENCTAVGIPARVVRRDGVKIGGGAGSAAADIITAELDHIHDPDPIALQISGLEEKLASLSEEVKRLEKEKGSPADKDD